jgi:hypothetical protein
MNSPAASTLTSDQALLELTLMNAEDAQLEFDDVFVAGVKSGLPPELLTRLQELWEQTKVVAGEVIAIGKVIVARIMAFLKAHPNLTVGAALGAAVGFLVGAIPFIGPLLQPLAMVLGSLYFGGAGAVLDSGGRSHSPLDAAIGLARAFFELFVAIMNGVADYWNAR